MADDDNEEFEALKQEVLSLRKFRQQQQLQRPSRSLQESTLLKELQQKCDRIIDLEVTLDQERGRADRLERERAEEDEALTGELRDIMANVGEGAAASNTAIDVHPAFPAPGKNASVTAAVVAPMDTDNNDFEIKSDSAPVATKTWGKLTGESTGWRVVKPSNLPQGNVRSNANGGDRGSDDAGGDGNNGNATVMEGDAKVSSGAVTGSPRLFSGWGLGMLSMRSRDPAAAAEATAESLAHVSDGSAGVHRSGTRQGIQDAPPPELTCEDGAGSPRAVGVWSESESRAAHGALRARLVEVELQRQEAEDMLKDKTDRSLRLEVQVEQLKNVVQTLSHTSSQAGTLEWREGSGSRTGNESNTDKDMLDFRPLLQAIPGVDPSVMLALHRTPWAEGVSEGIRSVEACFEWQGKDRRREWISTLNALPSELTRLPYHRVRPTSPTTTATTNTSRPDTISPRPDPDLYASSRFSASTGSQRPTGRPSVSPELTRGSGVPMRGDGKGLGEGRVGGLVEKIGGAVAAFGGRVGVSGEQGVYTDENVTMRFALSGIELPSNHWEWVGGWMVDSETEAFADQDGWVYGDMPRDMPGASKTSSCQGSDDGGTSRSTNNNMIGHAADGRRHDDAATEEGAVGGRDGRDVATEREGTIGDGNDDSHDFGDKVDDDRGPPVGGARGAPVANESINVAQASASDMDDLPFALPVTSPVVQSPDNRDKAGGASRSTSISTQRHVWGDDVARPKRTEAPASEDRDDREASSTTAGIVETREIATRAEAPALPIALTPPRSTAPTGVSAAAGTPEDGTSRSPGFHRPGGVKGIYAEAGEGSGHGEANFRRRRLVRLRMVTRVEGAREVSRKFLETMARLSSLEILVRKLSGQVVSQHRQVTGLEGQVAFLAPLRPKLRQACALGRKDRQRGDVLMRRLIEAENELKVLKRCMGSDGGLRQQPPEAEPSFAPAIDPSRHVLYRANHAIESRGQQESFQRHDATGPVVGHDPITTRITPSTRDDGARQGRVGVDLDRAIRSSFEGVPESEKTGAWGWMRGIAQRSAGTLGRMSPAPIASGVPRQGQFTGEQRGEEVDRGHGDTGVAV